MSTLKFVPQNVGQSFKEASELKQTKRMLPFSVRFTPDERAWLDAMAGYRPLGSYIRAKLLEDYTEKRRELRKPAPDSGKLAIVLSTLAESRLSSNLNQLARHANSGTLDISDNVESELHAAYEAIIEMRDTLLEALGKRPKQER